MAWEDYPFHAGVRPEHPECRRRPAGAISAAKGFSVDNRRLGCCPSRAHLPRAFRRRQGADAASEDLLVARLRGGGGSFWNNMGGEYAARGGMIVSVLNRRPWPYLLRQKRRRPHEI